MQVASAGAQTNLRVMNPCYKSSVSHASQQVVADYLLSRIILQYVAVFQPPYSRSRPTQPKTATILPDKSYAVVV